MRNYDIPEVPATLAEIKSVRAALSIDGQNDRQHPFFDSGHPAHGDWIAFAGVLAEREVALEAETKQSEQDTAIRDCPDVDINATTEDQIKALESTPGFLDGTLRRSDRPRHDKILAARDALYERREAEKGDDE